ncbi:hypothetical protein NM688_g8118 [Phlebia brevispora]|uniref:Uncharacterized protein n=1 Tax=Phlebia brevispora TaxID=194682 RepID=A0ACC1RX23_9APHY|nr:hypothetical protein NM688_g8118 [Phlebia brevispora]
MYDHSLISVDALTLNDIRRLEFRAHPTDNSDPHSSSQKRCVKVLRGHPDRTRFLGLPDVMPMRFQIIAEIVPEDGFWFAIEDTLKSPRSSTSTAVLPPLSTTSVVFWVQGRIHDTAAAVQWRRVHKRIVQIMQRFPNVRTDTLFRVVEETGMIRLCMQGIAQGQGFPIRGREQCAQRWEEMPLNTAVRIVFILEVQDTPQDGRVMHARIEYVSLV